MKILQKRQVNALTSLSSHVYGVAKSKGFHDNKKKLAVGDWVSNLHGEVSELWEAYRKGALNKKSPKSAKTEEMGLGTMSNAEEELADILIRCLDTAQSLGVDIARAVRLKDAYNQTREHKHGGKLC